MLLYSIHRIDLNYDCVPPWLLPGVSVVADFSLSPDLWALANGYVAPQNLQFSKIKH